jgi:hypothetical protein
MFKRKVTARQSAPSFLDHDSRYSGFRSRLASSRPTFSSSPRAAAEVLDAIKEGMDAADKDVPFSLLYLYDDQAAMRLARASGIESGQPASPAVILPGGPWPDIPDSGSLRSRTPVPTYASNW